MEISDHELMQRIKNEDITAFDILVKRWEHKLFNVVYKVIFDIETTRDICQEVFLQVYKSAKKYNPSGQFEQWLYRIAINRCINELRKGNHCKAYSLHEIDDDMQLPYEDNLIDPKPKPDEAIQQDEVISFVQNALKNLPPDQRIIVVLRHYEGLKFQQIAEILNCPLGTVKSRMRSALDKLRIMLKHLV